MRRGVFLERLRERICATADDALRPIGRSSEGCPAISYWFAVYGRHDAATLERAAKRYAPEAAGAQTADDLLPPLVARVRVSLDRWVATGVVSGLPEGIDAGMVAATVAANLIGAAEATASQIGSLASAASSSVIGAASSAAATAASGAQAIGAGLASAGSAITGLFLASVNTELDRPDEDPLAVRAAMGAGEPLDAATRLRMESAFGTSFGGVRIHRDADAAGTADRLVAHAVTVGSDIAFAGDAYRPGTIAGDALIAHELAHTIQQQGAVSVGHDGAGAVEREADRAAGAAVFGLWTTSATPARSGFRPSAGSGLHLTRCGGQRQAAVLRTPAAPTAPSGTAQSPAGGAAPVVATAGPGARYDTTTWRIPAPPAGYTLADVTKDLRAKQGSRPSDITSWSTAGVTAGSADHILALYAVWQVASHDRWGTETDLIIPSAQGARIAVQVTIDASGHAVGTRIAGAPPTVAQQFATTADAIAGLKATFGLADVRGEHRQSWNVDRLNKVAAAWARLSRPEAAALAGYTLILTDNNLRTPEGERVAGLTSIEDNTAGRNDVATFRKREIRFRVGLFDGDAQSFVGDSANAAPASFITILHEVGHAQESKVADDAMTAVVNAMAEGNRVSIRAVGARNAAARAMSRFRATDRATSRQFLDAFDAAHRAIQAFRLQADPTRMAALDAPAAAAVNARDAAKAALPAGSPAHAAFAAAIADQDSLLAAARDLLTKRRARAQATDPTGMRSRRLQAFVDFVNAKGIEPITKYAKDNWPAKPGEFYAEAFTLWHNDPTFLGSSSPALKAWFDAGEHLK
jgi:hypothetical protein